MLLPGSDIIDMAVGGSDGKTIYAIVSVRFLRQEAWAQESGPWDIFSIYHMPKLWKSTDGGVTGRDPHQQGARRQQPADLPDGGVWLNDAEDFTFFTTVAAPPMTPTSWSSAAGASTRRGPRSGRAALIPWSLAPMTAPRSSTGWAAARPSASHRPDISMEVNGKYNIAVGTWDWEGSRPWRPRSPMCPPWRIPRSTT